MQILCIAVQHKLSLVIKISRNNCKNFIVVINSILINCEGNPVIQLSDTCEKATAVAFDDACLFGY